MMAGFIGRIDLFDEALEDWPSYSERLKQYLIVNKVDEESKVAALISLVGPKIYKLLKSLVAPEAPATKNYDDLITLLTDHLSPKPLIIAERFKFHKTDQNGSENISEYIAELRRLASTCEFGAFLNQALRDRLVCGMRAESIQKRLLTEANLDLEKAIRISVASEIATKDAGLLNKASVNKVGYYNRSRRGGKPPNANANKGNKQYRDKTAPGNADCNRCGGKHESKDCRYKSYKCNACSKLGHLERVCRNKTKESANYVKSDESVNETDQNDTTQQTNHLGMFNVRDNSPPIKVQVGINDVPVVMEVDTGAAKTIIPEDVSLSFRTGEVTFICANSDNVLR